MEDYMCRLLVVEKNIINKGHGIGNQVLYDFCKKYAHKTPAIPPPITHKSHLIIFFIKTPCLICFFIVYYNKLLISRGNMLWKL